MTTTLTSVEATPTDHQISVDTAAADLGILPATARTYLRAGKLAHLGTGISANSVDTYRTRRDAGLAKFAACRFRTAEAYIEQAAAHWAEAARLEALARDLKAQARPVLDAAGPGRHGPFDIRLTDGRTIQDTAAVRARYAELGEPVPTKKAAGSYKVTRVA